MTKKKAKNKKHKDKLSQLVVDYRKTHDAELFRDIIKIAWGLPVKVLMKFTSSPVFYDYERDEYLQEMRTVILLEAIESYKQTRGRFSTHYYWQLMHYLSNKVRHNPKNETNWVEVNKIAAQNRKLPFAKRKPLPYKFRFFHSIESLQAVNSNFDVKRYDKIPTDITKAYINKQLNKFIADKFALQLFKALYMHERPGTLRKLAKRYGISPEAVRLKTNAVKEKLKKAILRGEIL